MNPSYQDRYSGLEKAEFEASIFADSVTDGCWEQILEVFFAAASTMSAGLCIYDEQLRYVQINEALAEINGLSVEAHLGRMLWEVVPDLAHTLEPICRQILETGKPAPNIEISGKTPAQPDVLRHWRMSFFPVPFSQSRGVGIIILETTERKKMEETLRAGEVRFKAIARHQSELHQEIQRLNNDLEGEVQARTAQLQLAFEFEATLKRITDRVRDSLDENQILQAAVRELALVMKVSCCNASLYDLEQGTSTTCYEYTHSMSAYQGRVSKFSTVPELYTQLSQGQYFQFCSLVPNLERGLVAMLACPMLDDQGVIGDLWLIHHKHYAFSEQDIRLVQQVANQCAIAIRQARLYEASQAQVKELERLNLLKDDFLSTVSHELRTPLSNMKMAIHMLRTAPTTEKRQRYLAILESECSRETELINDLLDLQRLENDCYAITLEAIDLQKWLPEMIAPFLSRAHERKQSLEIELPLEISLLLSDRKSLERILAELLNNACKYTPPNGAIALKVSYAQQPNSGVTTPDTRFTTTTFTVSNQADVPLAELPRMFEKFYRIPKSDPWQQGGTGLGLALVKKLVETLQGSIEASSTNGWTTLKVHLPPLKTPPE